MNIPRDIFVKVAAMIFLLIGILQLIRVIYGWEAVIGGVTIPSWASILAVLVALTMSYGLAKKTN